MNQLNQNQNQINNPPEVYMAYVDKLHNLLFEYNGDVLQFVVDENDDFDVINAINGNTVLTNDVITKEILLYLISGGKYVQYP